MAAEGDDLRLLIKSVFIALARAVAETAMKHNLVTTQTAREMVSEEFQQRRSGTVEGCSAKLRGKERLLI
jgi:hypothetical protein